MARVEPAQLQLAYSLANADNYIDIAKDLSVLNRRLYRQGMVYGVANVQIYFDGADSAATDTSQQVRSVTVSTIPNTWVAHNAWMKGFKAWNEQQKRFLTDTGISGNARPRWADFKVAMDPTHVALDSGSGDQDISLDVREGDFSSTATPDEWLISQFVWEDAASTGFSPRVHMLGQVNANNESYVGLIENYGDSRVQVSENSPNLPSDASDSIYALIHAGTEEVNTDVVNDLELINDSPPYDATSYIGGAAVSEHAYPVGFAAVNVQNPVGNVGSFIAPCGLLKITVDAWYDADDGAPGTDLTDLSVSNTRCIVTLAPGTYRGVAATRMGQ